MSGLAHVVFVISEPGKRPVEVKRWAEVLEVARESGWRAQATQYSYDEDGNLLKETEIQSHQIEDDFNERAR